MIKIKEISSKLINLLNKIKKIFINIISNIIFIIKPKKKDILKKEKIWIPKKPLKWIGIYSVIVFIICTYAYAALNSALYITGEAVFVVKESSCNTNVLKDCVLDSNGGISAIESKTINNPPDFTKNAEAQDTYDLLPGVGLHSKQNTTPNENGMYAMEDEYGTSYYFRGNGINNNVLFAGFQWKIIRINGDGSIRLIYNGTEEAFNTNHTVNTTHSTTTPMSISGDGSTYTYDFNTSSNDNRYVGYMYGNTSTPTITYYDAHTNIVDSNVKTILDTWYSGKRSQDANFSEEEKEQIVDNIFCNNRIPSTSVVSSNYLGGYGTTTTYYSTYIKTMNNQVSLLCTNNEGSVVPTNDQFTVDQIFYRGTPIGNGDLTYPVGLITFDERRIAGITDGIYSNFYLSNIADNPDFWTMSPSYLQSSVSHVLGLGSSSVVSYVRPVINLSSEVTFTKGDGSNNNPYVVAGIPQPICSTNILKDCVIEREGGPLAIQYKTIITPPNFSKNAVSEEAYELLPSGDITKANSVTNENGIYVMLDEYGMSYYFRGAVDNNVLFGGFQWKIIRINGDGSIRLLYNGTEAAFNTKKTMNTKHNSITSPMSIISAAFALTRNDNKYVGYMYGDASTPTLNYLETHTNTIDSNAKTILDTWYSGTRSQDANFSKAAKALIVDNIFCNDRKASTNSSLIDGLGGYGTTATFYGAYIRNKTNDPTLLCTNNQITPSTNDQFTVDQTFYNAKTLGNGALTYPIGLITADEMRIAGSSGSDTTAPDGNSFCSSIYCNYLSGMDYFYSMSPKLYLGVSDIFCGSNNVGFSSLDYRPVINLSSTVTFTKGDGSLTNPYVIYIPNLATIPITVTGPFTTSSGSTPREWAKAGDTGYYRIIVNDSETITLDTTKITVTNSNASRDTITGNGTTANPYIVPVTALASRNGEVGINIDADAFIVNDVGNKLTVSNNFTVDTTAPVITVDPTTVNITAGGSYNIMTGVSVVDNLDTSVVVSTSGSVNFSVPNTYTITYNATDVAGNSAISKTRTINIIKEPSVTLTNLVSNGSFETNTSGWTLNYTMSIDNTQHMHGLASGLQTTIRSGNPFISRALIITNGHIYYITAYVRLGTSGITNPTVAIRNNTTALYTTPALTLNTWTRASVRWQANTASLALQLYYGHQGAGGTNVTLNTDNIMVIDLTAGYGSGNEPSVGEMDTIITNNGGYWDGSKALE